MTNELSGMTWTSVGAELFDRHQAAAAGKHHARNRQDVTAAISRLTWRQRGDARDVPAMAGQAFAYAINYLGLPSVELVAWNGSIEVEDPRDHTAGAYGLLRNRGALRRRPRPRLPGRPGDRPAGHGQRVHPQPGRQTTTDSMSRRDQSVRSISTNRANTTNGPKPEEWERWSSTQRP